MEDYDRFLAFISTLSHPSYEKDGCHYQWGLDTMLSLDAYLANPSQKLARVIHVCGTNGKGSCASFIASVFMRAGYKVGVYGSPQLFDIRERIRINGEMMSKDDVCIFWNKIKDYVYTPAGIEYGSGKISSYSEIFVAMAFDHFVKNSVDIAIIEVGIGGKLDPTNIIPTPLLSIITSIGLDHTDIFGYSTKNIAKEKSGIIKAGGTVIVGAVDMAVKDVIASEASRVGAQCYFAEDYYGSLSTERKAMHNQDFDLKGDCQKLNIKTVCCAIDLAVKADHTIKSDLLYETFIPALQNASRLTGLRGRWEVLCEIPLIIADLCSNPLGLKINIRQIQHLFDSGRYGRIVFILGLTSNKHLSIAEFLPKNAEYIFTESRSFIDTAALSEGLGITGKLTSSVHEAIDMYWREREDDDLVYIGGSIHILTDAILAIKAINRDTY